MIGPLNNSGTFHGNITFFYNVSDASDIINCSLIINDKFNMSNNTLITKDALMSFNVQEFPVAPYNWSINCTDILANAGGSPKRGFTINLMQFFNTKINFSAIDIRNVTNFTIHEPDFGIINFTQGIDFSQGFDIDRYVNISFNRIEINSSAIPHFNVSATLQLVGLTFTNPRILFDGNVCPASICKKVSYDTSGGVLVFNVTHFTAYSSEETPAESESPAPSSGSTSSGGGGGGGGGGGTATPVVTDFSIDKTSIKVILKQGETKKETLTLKNIGTTIFDIKSVFEGVGKFKIKPEAEEIVTSLSPNEEKTIEFVFKALENEKPEIYPGKITLKSPSVAKEIATIVEVDSAQPLVDVDVEVEEEVVVTASSL